LYALLVAVVTIPLPANSTAWQARHQDIAAGGAKNKKGGHILKILYWMYTATRWPKREMGRHRFQMGEPGTTGPPLAMALLPGLTM